MASSPGVGAAASPKYVPRPILHLLHIVISDNSNIDARIDVPKPSHSLPHMEADSSASASSPLRGAEPVSVQIARPDDAAPQRAISAYNPFLLWRAAKMVYSAMVDMLCRPPRDVYDPRALGPARFPLGGSGARWVERVDFSVRNARGLALACSLWRLERAGGDEPAPCVVCLHGNSGSRAAALANAEAVLSTGASLVGFDFAGSGRSEGEYVTLGWHEKDDVAAVMEYLRGRGLAGAIALWGRSMGAATALMYAPGDPSVAALILDSPFADLRQLVDEIVLDVSRQVGAPLPSWGVAAVLTAVHATVLRSTGLDFTALRPVEAALTSFVPALVVTGKDDSFVRPHHSVAIHKVYGGEAQLVVLEGDHNSLRPVAFQERAAAFLRTSLRIPVDLGVPMTSTVRPMEALAHAFRQVMGLGRGVPASVRAAAAAADADVRIVVESGTDDADAELLARILRETAAEAAGDPHPAEPRTHEASSADLDDEILQAVLAQSRLEK